MRKTIEGFVPATAGSIESNRRALASLKARMAAQGEFRLQRQLEEIVARVTGVRP